MHTQHAGIEATWTQSIRGEKYLRVFMWNDPENMCTAFDKEKRLKSEHDYCGRCVTFYSARLPTGEIKYGRKFAEIHLCKEYIGAGYVAHELQHLMNYWAWRNRLNPRRSRRHDEDIAMLCGDVTTGFWNEFYKRYKVEAGSNVQT